VEQLVGHAGSTAGGGPGLFEIADGLTVPVEHQRSNADISVLHKGGFKGGSLTIEVLKSDRIFACNLDSPEGKRALGFLTRAAQREASTPRRSVPSSSTSRAAGRSPR
jgi:hypothetical protein